MKFILQLIFNVTASFLSSITKMLTGHKRGKHDIYFLVCGLLLVASLFNQWILILAFLALLPSFKEQLIIKHLDDIVEHPADTAAKSFGSEQGRLDLVCTTKISHFKDLNISRENPQCDTADPDQATEVAHSDSNAEVNAPAPKLRPKKTRKTARPPASERKRAQKEDWGVPTLRAKDQSGKIIPVNSEKPVPIESEYFKGFILIMVKTDGDQSEYNRYASHFEGKQRKFEVQFQGHMKFLPKGEVMLGGELFDKMQMSFVTRSLLSFLMKFAMSLNPFLHFNFGEEHRPDGVFEYPHLTFPLFRVMDRVVVTPPGMAPPELGRELPEETADRLARRSGKGPNMCFREGHTYSFSFHSMYVDFPRWSICNFPGYKYIDLRGFFGQQSIKVVCYELQDPNNPEAETSADKPSSLPHYNSFKKYLMSMELSHVSIMSTEELALADEELPYEDGDAGEEEGDENDDEDGEDNHSDENSEDLDLERTTLLQERLSDVNDLAIDEIRESKGNGGRGSPTFEGDNFMRGQVSGSQIPSEEQDDDDMLSLGSGIEYVSANSVVSIISLPAPWEGTKDDSSDECYFSDCHTSIGDVGGVAMRKECRDVPIVRFIRPSVSAASSHTSSLRYPLKSLRRTLGGVGGGNSKNSPAGPDDIDTSQIGEATGGEVRPSYLRSGDAVTIQCASTGRYLTVHRGWWISWTAEDTGSKCVFSINMMNSTGLSYSPNGSRIIAGKPFRLRSVRWPDWEIGCYDSRYAQRVGQPVVLYQSRLNSKRTARDRPVIWGKNGKLVTPLVLCVMPEVNVSYVGTDIDVKNSDAVARARAAFVHSPSPSKVGTGEGGLDDVLMIPSGVAFVDLEPESLSPANFDMVIIGWAEVLNRKHNRPQLAYVIQASYGTGDNIKRWTVLRTQEDLDAIIQRIPVEYGGGISDPVTPIGSGAPKRIMRYYGAVGGRGLDSPQLTSTTKLETMKRNVAFRTISARHQCAADQSVHLMSLRVQELLSRDPSSGDKTSPAATDSEDEDTSGTAFANYDGELGMSQSVDQEEQQRQQQSAVSIERYISASSATSGASTVAGHPNSPRYAFLRALNMPQILDTWFVHGSDVEKYLLAPINRRAPKRKRIAIVARALWDTHWREELMVLYPSYIAFYSPLAKKASWTLYLQELIGISHVNEDASPLPGYAVLRIETIGRIHYISFSNKDACNEMAGSILEQFSGITFDVNMPSFGDMTDPRDRFVLKSGRWRPAGRRLILNSRKFSFDLNSSSVAEVKTFGPDSPETYWDFSARLLKTVFQLDSNNSIKITPETLKNTSERWSGDDPTVGKVDVSFESDADGLFPGREKIISFLDDTVRLKLVDLQNDVDLNSPEALCFFINIYHTLLIHARLVLSPPSTQDWATFFDNVSYEIGGDVFSLAELEHCVICGKLNRPATMPRNYCAPPPPTDDHYAYALYLSDRRTRFVVNSCSVSNPPVVYVMRPDNLYVHLNEASIGLFEYCFSVDMKKRTVVLPKMCETHRADFGSNVQEVLRHCLRYLGRENWEKLSILLTSQKPPIVKFQEMKCRSHDSLQLIA